VTLKVKSGVYWVSLLLLVSSFDSKQLANYLHQQSLLNVQ